MILYLSTDKARVLFADGPENITEMSREEAIELAELILAALRPPQGPMVIVDKQAEVKRLYLEGLTVRAIVQKLGLAPHTVRTYVTRGGYANRHPANQARMREMMRQRRAAE